MVVWILWIISQHSPLIQSCRCQVQSFSFDKAFVSMSALTRTMSVSACVPLFLCFPLRIPLAMLHKPLLVNLHQTDKQATAMGCMSHVNLTRTFRLAINQNPCSIFLNGLHFYCHGFLPVFFFSCFLIIHRVWNSKSKLTWCIYVT